MSGSPLGHAVVNGETREQLVNGLIRIGEKLMTGEDKAEVDAYFAPEYRFTDQMAASGAIKRDQRSGL